MIPATFDFGTYSRGDTLAAQSFLMQLSDGATPPTLTPLDITGVSITCMFKLDSSLPSALTLSTSNGKIILSDPTIGQFRILASVLDIPPGIYYHDIEFVFPSGEIRTFFRGTLIIEQDYTN